MLKKLLLLFITFNLSAEILQPEQAFISSAKIQNNNLIVNFKIADKYYLYKDKTSIKVLDDTKLGKSIFSKAEIKNDEFFGKVEVYHHNLKITTPIKSSGNQVKIEVFFQGCWEGGVCYPPISKKFTIKADDNIANNDNKTNFFKSIVQQNDLEDPVNIDVAFKFNAFKFNDNTIRVVWDIRDNYYLYDDKFNFSIKGADFGEIKFPTGISKKDEFFGDIIIHKKQLIIDIPLTNIKGSVDLTINYQGCWEGGVCYPPTSKKTNILFKAGGSTSIDSSIEQTITTSQLNEEQKIAQGLSNQTFFWILISFFGFGILAAFTSCILPMIPILSSLIIGSNNPTKKKAFVMSLVFVIFMALTYSVVGVLAGLFGGNLQTTFQNPWIISAFSLMFVALAFSMFGYYEIKIPNWLQDILTKISNKQKGGHLMGVAIMGVLSALIVGPCAAPVISGALLYIGDSGNAILGGSALFMMGLGMGLPLIIAGVGVATLRAGVWMDTVKSIFGIVMLGTAIYFLERILDEDITLIMWATLLTIAPIVLGVTTSMADNKPIHRIFKAMGLIILGYGILLWILVAKGGIANGGDMFAPLKSNINFATNTINIQQKVQFKKVKTLTELQQIIQTSNKLIMLDFYADWCIYCKVYDKKVFTDRRVVDTLKNALSIKIDITKNNTNNKEILKSLNISAPPAILFFKNGNELKNKRIIGEKNADEFLAILQSL